MSRVRMVSRYEVSPQSTTFHCSTCSKDAAEFRCSRCGAVKYCSKTCQEKQWDSHKSYCIVIKKLKLSIKRKAYFLERYVDFYEPTPRNVFETEIGHFWDLIGPRAYCRDRKCLAMALHRCGQLNDSRLASELALEHLLDLIELCGADYLNIYTLIPCLYIALGRLQEAYNFLKWWNVVDGLDFFGLYTECGSSLSFFNFKDENMFEEVGKLSIAFCDTNDLISLFWLKYCLLNAVQGEMDHDMVLYETFLQGTDSICGKDSSLLCLQGCWPVLKKIKEYVTADSSSKVSKLKVHLWELVQRVDKSNKYVIPGFLDAVALFGKDPPNFFTPGSQAEAYNFIDFQFIHWHQTPYLLDYLYNLYKKMHGKKKAAENLKLLVNKSMLSEDYVL